MDHNARLEQLHTLLERLISPPPSAWERFQRSFTSLDVQKGDFLVQAGDVSHDCFFVCKGLLRNVYTTQDGREFNKSFLQEGSFAGGYISFLLGIPMRYSIQALEDTVLLKAKFQSLRSFYEEERCWERLGRLIAEGLAMRKLLREGSLLLDSAEERYLQFVRESPELEQRLPQYHIASYLGITPVALSRIRRRLRDQRQQESTL